MEKQIDIRGFVIPYRGEVDLNGTSLMGEFEVTYKEIKRIFGKENDVFDSYKSDASWKVMTPAGPASIYNYKNGKNYLGKEGTPKTNITEWHIGAHNINAYAWVCFALFAN